MRLRRLNLRLRSVALRGVPVIVFAVSSVAVGAPGSAQPVIDPPRAEVAAERSVDRGGPPYHPVDGEVDYGNAIAAFGHARGRPHQGQDVFAPAGTPLVAPRRTVVLETGSDGGRGNWVALYHRGRDETYVYFHMIRPASVKRGQHIRPGARVGAVGCTGSCSGDHLHFEIREGRGAYGEPRDPLPALKRWRRA